MNAAATIEECPTCGSPSIYAGDGSQISMTCPSCEQVEQVEPHDRTMRRLAGRQQSAKREAEQTYGHDLHAWQLHDGSRAYRTFAVCRSCGARVTVAVATGIAAVAAGDALERHCGQQQVIA